MNARLDHRRNPDVHGRRPRWLPRLPGWSVAFRIAGESERAWVAKAVQQNLLAELSRVNSVQAVTGEPARQGPGDGRQSRQDANADYVVCGSYQAIEGDLRITGQVLDVDKKETVAGLKATGSERDLFGLEDVIASQVKRTLPQPVAVVQS